jgi:hypothetical protein
MIRCPGRIRAAFVLSLSLTFSVRYRKQCNDRNDEEKKEEKKRIINDMDTGIVVVVVDLRWW